MKNNDPVTGLFNVSGKVALVTGSTRGLGFTLASGLARAGATIVVNGFDKTRLKQTVDRMRKDGFNAAGFAFDVCDEKSINKSMLAIERKFGQIDILVNNAGIMIRKPLEEFSLLEWQKMIDINLTGAFLVSKAAVRGMIERRAGKIINICSVQSELARPTITPYTASKGGLRNLTGAWLLIGVNIIFRSMAWLPGTLKRTYESAVPGQEV